MTPDPATNDSTEGTDEISSLRAELERVTAEKTGLFERLARAQAEFQNSQRRLEQSQEQAVQYANQSLLKQLLPLIDNLERAISVDPEKTDAKSILSGVQVLRDQFEALLRAQRIEFVAPKPGDAFDPSKHEAVMQQPSDHPEGTVAAAFSRGYALMGRTLRPAQVAVSKGK